MNDIAHLDARLADAVRRLAALAVVRRHIDDEETAIKQAIREALRPGQVGYIDGVPAVRVTANRRFSEDAARRLLPADVLTAISANRVDGTLAKKVLSPTVYAACQIEAGEPVVRLA